MNVARLRNDGVTYGSTVRRVKRDREMIEPVAVIGSASGHGQWSVVMAAPRNFRLS